MVYPYFVNSIQASSVLLHTVIYFILDEVFRRRQTKIYTKTDNVVFINNIVRLDIQYP